jgi:hypothetical protein
MVEGGILALIAEQNKQDANNVWSNIVTGSPGYELTESAPRPSTGGTVGSFT